MQLYCTITANNGQRVPLSLEDSTDVTPAQLRQKVAEATKIPLKDLRLIFRGRMIKDDDDIASVVDGYKLEADSVLHCMGKPVVTTAASSESTGTAPAAAAVSAAEAGIPNRTVVPPLSTSTTATATPAPAAAAAAASLSGLGVDRRDPLDKALHRLRQNNPPSVYATAVGTLEKVLGNIVSNPMEEKYRRVKKNNAAFGKRLGKLVGGHDCMLAAGFAVEQQDGNEVYQLHASPENWTALIGVKKRVEAASNVAKADQRATRPPTAFGVDAAPLGMGSTPNSTDPSFRSMNSPMDPNYQSMMSQMMSNPEALGQALQNPMVLEMMRNDPNISPMVRQQMESMANNPAMLQQIAQRMQNPAVRARLQQAMQAGGVPGMGGMGSMGGAPAPVPQGGGAAAPPPPPQNDQGQTEDEMIAEAIRRSLEDN